MTAPGLAGAPASTRCAPGDPPDWTAEPGDLPPAAATGPARSARPASGAEPSLRAAMALAERARRGDRAALVALHRLLAPRLAARVWRAQRRVFLAGVGLPLERADLEQQAFFVLLEALHTWPGAGDFAAWFGRAAGWYLRRYARRWYRSARPPLPGSDEADHAARAVERVHWATLLAELPAPERAILWWRFWQDLTYGQIATRYGVPPATAHDRCRNALARLRHLLGGAPRGR